MKKKILLSPLIIIILIIVLGVGVAGAAILISGSGGTENVNLQKGLVGHWKLDGNAKDSTPYGNNGTVTGAILTTDRKGQANKAYSFDGTNDYVSIASTSNLNPTSAFTLEAWVKKGATKAQNIIFNDVHELKLDSSNKAVLRLLTGARPGTDMDMETAGVVNWDSFNSPATKEKNTTNPIQGTKDLHVIARDTATHDGVYQSLVSENKTYRVKVSYRVVSGSLNIQLGTSAEANTGLGNVGLGLTGSGTVVSYVLTTAGAWGLIMTSTNAGEFYVDDIEVKEVGATLTSSGTASTNFDHIVATYDGSVSNIYINGALDNSLTQAVTLSTDNLATLIGAGATGGTGYEQDFFNGSIDDVRIYNRALSATEVTALYQEYDPSVQISDLQKGLVGHWKMNGNAKDSTPYANTGTVTGAILTTDRKGQLSKAYSFDGSNDAVDAGTGTSLDLGSGDITLSAWIYLDAYNNQGSLWNAIIMDGELVDVPGPFYGFATDSSLKVYFGARDIDTNAVSNSAVNGKWVHAVGVRASDVLTLYIDGVLQTDTGAGSGTLSNAVPLYFGRDNITSRYFDGSIDDVRVYNRALSATEVTALYQEYDPGIVVSDLQKGLVGNWKLDGNAKDSTPYGNNGTITGATLTTDRKGQLSKAYNFDGSSYIVAPASSSLNFGGSAMTVAMWVKPNSSDTYDSTWRALAGQRSECGGSFNWQLYAFNKTDGLPFFALGDGQGSAGSSSILSLNVWSHLVGTYDGTTIRFYVNGVEAGNSPQTGTIHSNSVITNIGYESCSTNKFYGGIDDVRIYNRALSPTEITALYQSY